MSVNKVILLGNVGKDPEVQYVQQGLSVARFPLATNEPAYKTADGTQIPERTEWHNIVAWRQLSQLAERYTRKGSQLYIEGKLTTRMWEDKAGVRHYVTEIIADKIELLGRRAEGQQ